MASWFYYNESGEKVGPVTGSEIKALASRGVITPETKIENEAGRSDVARKVKGLTFPEVQAPDAKVVQAAETVADMEKPVVDVLNWIDFNLNSMKMSVVGNSQNEDLKRDLENKVRRLPGNAQYKELLNKMTGIVQKSDNLFRDQIRHVNQFIENERSRIERQGDKIDPEYKAAFEQKAAEAKAYIDSLPISLRAAPVAVAVPSTPVEPAANDDEDEAEWVQQAINLSQSPLHEAARKNDVALIASLIKAGADANVRDRGGNTPLHNAAWHRSVEAATALLHAGANVNAKTVAGVTPLHTAACNHTDKIVILYIQAGADVNARLDDGKTPLHYATMLHADWVINNIANLVAHGAILEMRDNDGKTPMQHAVENKNQRAIDALIKAGARPYTGATGCLVFIAAGLGTLIASTWVAYVWVA